MDNIHLRESVKNLESKIDELLLSLIDELAELVSTIILLLGKLWLISIGVIDELLGR